IEFRLTGQTESARLTSALADLLPEGNSIVLILFDGLGVSQVAHPTAVSLQKSMKGTLESGFPSTTSTSLATVATGLAPGGHGIVSHLMWMPEHKRIVNTLKWVDLTGAPVDHDYANLLPKPNLWERIRASGIEPITVQPGDFENSPLTRMLYRGARFEGIWGIEDLINATVSLAAEPGRFIFTYVPHVDYAGHVFGLTSPEFNEAIGVASRIWDEIHHRLPAGVALLGTADHGLIDYAEDDKMLIRDARFDTLRMGGDSRGVQVWSTSDTAGSLASMTGGELVAPESLIGPKVTTRALERLPPNLLLAPGGKVLLPRGFDKRLRAYHGGLAPGELLIPLLLR
ncbi:MAG TPA: alkaline phosphatase family protein, partial [Acidimicrobiia bacterium]